MPSTDDQVINMFHCLFIVLKIQMFSMRDQLWSNDQKVPCIFFCVVLSIPVATKGVTSYVLLPTENGILDEINIQW